VEWLATDNDIAHVAFAISTGRPKIIRKSNHAAAIFLTLAFQARAASPDLSS
jgi:hypothetical protein